MVVKSDIESFVAKLPSEDQSNVSQQIVCAANEVLRKVAIKVKQGAMGRADSIECRAAIILDIILRRNGKPGITNLNKLCGIKRKDLENMSTMILNYIKDKPKPVHPETDLGSQSPSKISIASYKLQSEEKSMIPVISVKLGSYVADSLGLSKGAELLYLDIKTHVACIDDKFKRSGYLQDMERNRVEYEAACCLLFMEENLVDNKEELKTILIDAANIQRNEFEKIYMVTKEFYASLCLHKQKVRSPLSREYKRQKLNNKVSTKVMNTELSRVNSLERQSEIDEQSERHPEIASKFTNSEAFRNWKAKTLQFAIEKSKLFHNVNSDNEALHHAATSILDMNLRPKIL
jgi:hypothetical protein